MFASTSRRNARRTIGKEQSSESNATIGSFFIFPFLPPSLDFGLWCYFHVFSHSTPSSSWLTISSIPKEKRNHLFCSIYHIVCINIFPLLFFLLISSICLLIKIQYCSWPLLWLGSFCLGLFVCVCYVFPLAKQTISSLLYMHVKSTGGNS